MASKAIGPGVPSYKRVDARPKSTQRDTSSVPKGVLDANAWVDEATYRDQCYRHEDPLTGGAQQLAPAHLRARLKSRRASAMEGLMARYGA